MSLICNLNLIKVIKRIFTAIVISAFIFSCNNAGDKTGSKKEDRVNDNENQGKNKDLIYLDTAENIYNILCQDWVMEDDAESLEGMTESSQMEIPYRSLCFSTKGTFVKNCLETGYTKRTRLRQYFDKLSTD